VMGQPGWCAYFLDGLLASLRQCYLPYQVYCLSYYI
jgi:hypothetical protein